jgi:hypothetical protein
LVNLEILNQLDWIYPDPGTVYEREIDELIRQLS